MLNDILDKDYEYVKKASKDNNKNSKNIQETLSQPNT